MLFSIWEFVINFLESFLFAIFVIKQCEKKSFRFYIPFQIFFLLGKSILTTILNFCGVSTLIMIFVTPLLGFIYICLFYKNSIFYNFFLSMIYSIFLLLSDAATALIPSYFLNIELTQLLYSGNLRIPFTLIYISIVALFVITFLLFNPHVFVMGVLEKISYFTISIICITLEEIIMIILLKSPSSFKFQTNLLLYVFGLSLFLFIFMTIYFYRLGKEKGKNMKLIQEITISKIENRQNEEIIKSVKNLRILKHDIKNHLNVLYDLLNQKRNEEAIAYIKNMNDSIEISNYTISTGILSIDCILTTKLSFAISNNIEVDHQIFLPMKLPFSDLDMCSLFGNLLDNAIEANLKLNPSNRKIKLVIKPFNKMLSIFVKNNSDGKYLFDSHGELVSTKMSERNEHGIGLFRIRDLVSKYDGMIQFEHEKETFSVSVLLPLNEID